MDDKGRLIVSGHLDREERSAHRITIMAETDASPALSAYYDLTVKVLDENDNAPAFSSDLYEVTVSEASVLVSVDVSDANDNAPIFPEGNYTCYVQVGDAKHFLCRYFYDSDRMCEFAAAASCLHNNHFPSWSWVPVTLMTSKKFLTFLRFLIR